MQSRPNTHIDGDWAVLFSRFSRLRQTEEVFPMKGLVFLLCSWSVCDVDPARRRVKSPRRPPWWAT